MATAPYGVRLLVGAATFAVEETIKLPKTILMYPMTLASQAAHLVMRFQQNLAELVIKGDSTLESIFPPKEEQPQWATFDEDLGDSEDDADALGSGVDATDPERRAEGRFALYTATDPPTQPVARAKRPATLSVAAPAVADELDYETLTLAQLRARLQSLEVDELEALLAYEEATKARAPFQTLLANRITHATAR
ncbi:lipid droplet-associated protein [Candidatus Mycobacterium methanotrophicum]|uniref:Lipid droplet-associated protein n=1 Tax=Candidatus Mycobacterium methanotrophicum TaxID=2943498 RepID=A0ABY4QHE7_9MYCO|nr:lipid droplet-associated protein [Candidatus Mycobacterium methanotrophicum]UQX10437.1 lipid droplet-associated protein [Candidatus Mycobacterium methanotrophicum]